MGPGQRRWRRGDPEPPEGTTLGPLTDRRMWRRFPWGWSHPVAARFATPPASADREGTSLHRGATWDEVMDSCKGEAIERVWSGG